VTRTTTTAAMRIGIAATAVALALALPGAARAQSTEAKLRDNQEELARIRRERAELEERLSKLRGTAHTMSDELQNTGRQHDLTQKAVSSLDRQLNLINQSVTETTANLVRAEDEATTKRAVLRRRLIDIYKRGPMFYVEALLSADSFGELVARYKYLHEIALRDRALVHRVEQLQADIRRRRTQLVTLQGDVTQNRVEKSQEEQRLQALEQQQQQSLQQVQLEQQKTADRLARVQKSEKRLNTIIANAIEEARRRAEVAARAAARSGTRVATTRSSISTSDYGRLDWPVDGNIVYNFGRVVKPDNTTIRWNGIGIAAAPGTPVHSVAEGTVVLAAPLGTYGQTVIIEHGGGDYSVYGSLASMAVSKGSHVNKGTVIGTVGSSDPDLPPHLHFEIRHGGPAVDPATWLRGGH
jgi:septal ring factor EnvC (AmiA/AmiB activator)